MAVAPSGSVAVTVTVSLPWSTPVNVTVLPFTLTVTTDVFEEAGVYVRGSPSGSLKFDDTSTSPLLPTFTDCAVIVPTAIGGPFTCSTVTVTVSESVNEPSLTVSSNSTFVSAVTSGASNVGDSALALLSITVRPAVRVHE